MMHLLSGEDLDYTVALALGKTKNSFSKWYEEDYSSGHDHYSTDWSLSGPILQELIAHGFAIRPSGDEYCCSNYDEECQPYPLHGLIGRNWETEHICTYGYSVLEAMLRAFLHTNIRKKLEG